MSHEEDLLRKNFAACRQRVERLRYSLEKNRHLFPFSVESLKRLSADDEESLDALILRYSQCVSMIQDQLFRGIALVEQEDLTDKSNRDKSLLMEKLGAIRSADEFGMAAVLRNKFPHHYPEENVEQMERLNLIIEEAESVLAVFVDIGTFLIRKGFVTVHP